MKPTYKYKAHLLRVIDGDTFDVTIDLGFRITTFQRLRLVGVNTPETRGVERPEGLRVKDYVKNLIEGKELTIETFKVGNYGRYICEVYLNDEEKLSQHLIMQNMAKEILY